MSRQQWYYAHLRWAAMVEGKEGLRQWEEAVHIFLSEDRDTAFQRALETVIRPSTAMTKGGIGWKAGWSRS